MRDIAQARVMPFAAVIAVTATALVGAPTAGAQSDTGYLTPPPAIMDILDAPPIPPAVVSPTGETMAILTRPSMPSLSELAEPMLRLAGYRVNPRTNGPHTTTGLSRITIRNISDGTEHAFDAPRETSLGSPTFSPESPRMMMRPPYIM